MNQSTAAVKSSIKSGAPAAANWDGWLRRTLREIQSGFTIGRVLSGLLALAISGLLTVGLILYWDLLSAMGPWAYLGVFASELISSASIFIPLPAHNYAMAMAITLDPYLLGLAGGIGAAIGEFTGYFLGKYGKKAAGNGRWFVRFKSMADRRFGLAVFIFAFMPAPIDFVGILAGAAGYPAWRFGIIVGLGKVLKITILTVAASYGLPLAIDFFA